jgi:hypothetical protein
MTPVEEKAKAFLARLNSCKDVAIDSTYLRGLFKGIVEAHWETSTNHGRLEPILGCYTVKSDSNPKGTLTVRMAYEIDKKNPNPLPSIVVDVGNVAINKLVLGNSVAHKDPENTNTRSWMAATQIAIQHRFIEPEDCLIAAQSTLEFLAGTSHELMRRLQLSILEPKGMTTVRQVESTPTKYFQVDVGLELQYNFTMSVNLESHRIKTLSNTFTAQ